LDHGEARFLLPMGDTLAAFVARNRSKQLRLATDGLPENSPEQGRPPTEMTLNVRWFLESSGIEDVGDLGGGLYYAPGPFRTPSEPADPGRTDRPDADFHGDVNFAQTAFPEVRGVPGYQNAGDTRCMATLARIALSMVASAVKAPAAIVPFG
jgi:hypothetical protein